MVHPSPARYKIRSVSGLTGFSPSLLRAWELRYGLLKPERTDTGHRLYSEQDLALLQAVKRLLHSGRSIGEIARLGRDALLDMPAPVSPPEPAAPISMDKQADELVRASLELDRAGLEESLNQAFLLLSPSLVIQTIIEPAASRIGELWAQGRCSIASEHLFSTEVGNRLRRLLELRPRDTGDLMCVCACFPDEQHELGLLSLSHALLRAGARPLYLGAALPFEDLAKACRRLKPRLALLSVTRRALFEAHAPQLLTLAPGVEATIVVGGQGVPAETGALEAAGVRVLRARPWASSELRDLLASLR